MSGRTELVSAIRSLMVKKEDAPEILSGKLGTYIGGTQVIRVSSRPDFVWVRIDGKDDVQPIMAFNDKVARIWNTPVLIIRDKRHPRFYKVIDRDISRYANWGGLSYLINHGEQHSFGTSTGSAWDPVWVQKRQFMPLLLRPTTNTGSMSAYVEPDYYFWNNSFNYFSGTGTADLSSYRPTSPTQGKFVTVYLNGDTGNLGYIAGSSFSIVSVPNNLIPYVPVPTPGQGIPLGAVFLTAATMAVNWSNLFDIRVIVSGVGSAGTTPSTHYLDPGSGTHIGNLAASKVALTDVGGFYTTDNVEAALQQLAGGSVLTQHYLSPSSGTHLGTLPATYSNIADAGGFFSSTDVEGALQELGDSAFGTGTPPSSDLVLNYLINGGGDFFQRQAPAVSATRSDDTYAGDRWYVLTQTASILTKRVTGDTHSIWAHRLEQNQVSAQRVGYAQIVEGASSVPIRGRDIRFQARINCSVSQAFRIAILGWTGTLDSVTSDVVNDWTSASYTAGGFFLGSNLSVIAVGSVTPGAGVWTDISVGGTPGSTVNNIVVMIWAEGTVAQNVTLDITEAGLYQVLNPQAWIPKLSTEELILCQRYYTKSFPIETEPKENIGSFVGALSYYVMRAGATANGVMVYLPVEMHDVPTAVTFYNPTAAGATWRNADAVANSGAATLPNGASQRSFVVQNAQVAGDALSQRCVIHWSAVAEL